ncbi:MAG: sensor histidine kinase [Acidimicrobiales bacterium]
MSIEKLSASATGKLSTYLDVALGLGFFAVGVSWLGTTTPGVAATHQPYALGVLLVALLTLPLVARRRLPLLVLLMTMAATVPYAIFKFPPGPIDLVELIAIYTVAVHRPPRVLGIGWVIVLATLGMLWATNPLWDAGAAEYGAVSVLFGLFTVAGLHQRSRLRMMATQADRDAEIEQAREDQAVAEARVAIAQELHDAVGHAQTVALLQAGIARMTFDSDPVRSRRALEVVEDRSRATLEEMQLLVNSLRNSGDADSRSPLPTLSDLDALVAQSTALGLEVSLNRGGTYRKLPAPVEVSAYRIIQEALTNVAKHANAERVEVDLCYRDRELFIEVRDDGVPLPRGAGSSIAELVRLRRHEPDRTRLNGGKGILGMRERVSALGGSLAAGLRRQGGFAVTAWIPIPEMASTFDTVQPESVATPPLRLVEAKPAEQSQAS